MSSSPRPQRPGERCQGPKPGGFTLIEVLVALGIVAIALTAGLKATASLTRNAQRQSDVMLAQICAENELIKLRLARQLPGVGDSSSDCEQASQTLQVQTAVRPTPNPNFLRVDARVFRNAEAAFQITTVMGRN
jgi:general secretion pathway protein I